MTELQQCDVEWIIRRLPYDVVTLLRRSEGKMFLAGGFIRSVICGEKVNDVDLFSSTKEGAQNAAWSLRNNTDKWVTTENAITLPGDPAIQFIHRWTFETPDACVASFDFTIAQAAVWWTKDGWKSVCSPRFYADLAAKRLVYTSPEREEEAGGSMLRVLKFYQRGYRIDVDSLGKVIARISMGDILVKHATKEADLAVSCAKLLREVDPQVDPDHESHLPGGDHGS